MPWMPSAAIMGGATLGSALIGADSANKARAAQSEATDKALATTNAQAATARADLAPYRQAGQDALARLQSMLGLPSRPSEADPRYGAIKDKLMADADAAHQAKYGMSIFDTKSGLSAPGERDKFNDHISSQAQQMFNDQYGGGQTTTAPGSGELLRKFQTSDLTSDPVYNSGLQFGLDEGTKAIERRAAAGGGYDSGATLKALTRFGNDFASTKGAESYGRFRDFQNSNYDKLAGIAGMGSGATTVGVGAGTTAASNLAALQSGQGNANAAAALAGGNALTGGLNNFNQYMMLRQLQGGGARTLSSDPSLTGAGDVGVSTT